MLCGFEKEVGGSYAKCDRCDETGFYDYTKEGVIDQVKEFGWYLGKDEWVCETCLKDG